MRTVHERTPVHELIDYERLKRWLDLKIKEGEKLKSWILEGKVECLYRGKAFCETEEQALDRAYENILCEMEEILNESNKVEYRFIIELLARETEENFAPEGHLDFMKVARETREAIEKQEVRDTEQGGAQ